MQLIPRKDYTFLSIRTSNDIIANNDRGKVTFELLIVLFFHMLHDYPPCFHCNIDPQGPRRGPFNIIQNFLKNFEFVLYFHYLNQYQFLTQINKIKSVIFLCTISLWSSWRFVLSTEQISGLHHRGIGMAAIPKIIVQPFSKKMRKYKSWTYLKTVMHLYFHCSFKERSHGDYLPQFYC